MNERNLKKKIRAMQTMKRNTFEFVHFCEKSLAQRIMSSTMTYFPFEKRTNKIHPQHVIVLSLPIATEITAENKEIVFFPQTRKRIRSA